MGKHCNSQLRRAHVLGEQLFTRTVVPHSLQDRDYSKEEQEVPGGYTPGRMNPSWQKSAEKKKHLQWLSPAWRLVIVAPIPSARPLSCNQSREPQQYLWAMSECPLGGQADTPHQVTAEGKWAQQPNAKHCLVWHILFLPKTCTRSPA